MNYRTYGRTSASVSEIGMGGHREGVETGQDIGRTARFYLPDQQRAAVVGAAIDQGVTYFDTTYGCEIASLGQSLRLLGRREGLFVSGMRVDFFNCWLKEKTDIRVYTRREVECRLKEFGFDRMEQFMMGAMDIGDPLSHPRGILDEAMEELSRLRQEGKIGTVGFSCHDPDYAARLLETHGDFDAVMTPYNFANRAAEGRLAEALKKTGAAWIVMKPLVWRCYGLPVTLLRNPRVSTKIDPAAPIGQLSIRFILDNPLVTTTVPAMNDLAHVRENLGAASRGPLTPSEAAQLQGCLREMDARDGLLAAIGGLQESNLRIRKHAIDVAARCLGLAAPAIDYESPDAPRQAQEAAERILAQLRNPT